MITGCESPLAWFLARKLDELGGIFFSFFFFSTNIKQFVITCIVLGFTIFAGFTKRACEDADQLKEEGTGRITILQLDVTSERQVRLKRPVGTCSQCIV